MSNCYQLVTANMAVKCSPQLHEELEDALDTAAANGLDDPDYNDSGFDFEVAGGELYIYASEFGNPDDIPAEVLAVVGKILTAAKLPYLEFGAAYYEDKRRPESCGGFKFRIHADGSIEYAKITWEGENNG